LLPTRDLVGVMLDAIVLGFDLGGDDAVARAGPVGIVQWTPAMAAGVPKTLWTMDDVVVLIDKAAPAPKKRGPCKKAA
jgi:hypothetical protein